jgi:hypothetical protein
MQRSSPEQSFSAPKSKPARQPDKPVRLPYFLLRIAHLAYICIYLTSSAPLLLLQQMPPKVQQKSKEAKMAAAMAGGKSKKKKWSKGKVRIASGFVLSFPPRAEITLSC